MPSAFGLVNAGIGAIGRGLSASGLVPGVRQQAQLNSATPETFSGVVGSALRNISNTAQSNSAWNAEQASSLRDWQRQMQKETMEFNSKEAAKNRDWQQMMSNTAHQREIADLKAAGLNPILSASGGNGAAVTSGSSASVSSPSGAKGEADTSANSALVSLLGTWLSSMTSLENQRVSAQNNLAVAEKYNAMSKYTAELSSMTSKDVARISGAYGLSSAQTAAWAAMQNAVTSAEASKAVAATNANASNYNVRKNSATSIAINDANIKNSRYLKDNYVDNPFGLLSNAVNVLTGRNSNSGFAQSAADVLKSMSPFERRFVNPDILARFGYSTTGYKSGKGSGRK
nr:hypothetical protein HSTRRNID_HSTRRNID_CDS_0006 [Microvirus sp.]CAI9750404.1 hypothetical protein JDKBDVFQ_JDKBDVFQ_CDS_0005 [Microvirus sp.]